MSSRTVLAPVSASASNARASIGPGRAVPRKSTLGGSSSTNTTATSQATNSTTGRRSFGGKQDEQRANGAADPRRSMLPSSAQSRPSLASTSRTGVPRASLSARPSLSTNRRNSRGSLAPPTGRYEIFGSKIGFFGFFPVFKTNQVCDAFVAVCSGFAFAHFQNHIFANLFAMPLH